jgi:hypothetical protein
MFGTSYSLGGPPRIERPLGLPVSVIHLRRDGQRITGQEFRAAVPLVGRLISRPTDKWQSGGGATHIADLLKAGALELGSLCKPIFNPVIERVDERGFILSGHEIMVIGTDKHELEQVWLVRPVAAADPFSG